MMVDDEMFTGAMIKIILSFQYYNSYKSEIGNLKIKEKSLFWTNTTQRLEVIDPCWRAKVQWN